MKWLKTLSATAMVLGLVGCGSSNGEPSHGLAPGTQLSSLGAEEIYALCRANEARSQRMEETVTVCTMSALTYTQAFDECSDYVTACVLDSEFDEFQRDRVSTSCGEDASSPKQSLREATAACSLAVQDIDMCGDATARRVAVQNGIGDCAELHDVDPPEASEEPPEECAVVESECPDLFSYYDSMVF